MCATVSSVPGRSAKDTGPADRPLGLSPRRNNDERHAQRRVVGEHPVRRLAVLAQPLAVVAGDGNHRRSNTPRWRSASTTRPTCASAYATSPS